jgi:hypothetical protein
MALGIGNYRGNRFRGDFWKGSERLPDEESEAINRCGKDYEEQSERNPFSLPEIELMQSKIGKKNCH